MSGSHPNSGVQDLGSSQHSLLAGRMALGTNLWVLISTMESSPGEGLCQEGWKGKTRRASSDHKDLAARLQGSTPEGAACREVELKRILDRTSDIICGILP